MDEKIENIIIDIKESINKEFNRPIKTLEKKHNYDFTKTPVEKLLWIQYKTHLQKTLDFIENKYKIRVISCFIRQDLDNYYIDPLGTLFTLTQFVKNTYQKQFQTLLLDIIKEREEKIFGLGIILKLVIDGQAKLIKTTIGFSQWEYISLQLSVYNSYLHNLFFIMLTDALEWDCCLDYSDTDINYMRVGLLFKTKADTNCSDFMCFIRETLTKKFPEIDSNKYAIEIEKETTRINIRIGEKTTQQHLNGLKNTAFYTSPSKNNGYISICFIRHSIDDIFDAIKRHSNNPTDYFFILLDTCLKIPLKYNNKDVECLETKILSYIQSTEFNVLCSEFLYNKCQELTNKYIAIIDTMDKKITEFAKNPDFSVEDLFVYFYLQTSDFNIPDALSGLKRLSPIIK